MTKLRTALLILPIVLAGCQQTPSQAGADVGSWLNNASNQTGQAIGTAGDRTGEALQNAGTSVRNAVAPPPPSPYAY